MPKTTGDEWTIHDYAVGDQIRTEAGLASLPGGCKLAAGDWTATVLPNGGVDGKILMGGAFSSMSAREARGFARRSGRGEWTLVHIP